MTLKHWTVAGVVWLIPGIGCGLEKATRIVRDGAMDASNSSSDGSSATIGPQGGNPGGADGGGYSANCSVCHGSAQSPAPPSDPSGNSATSAPGVGAHAQHLGASTWHGQIACSECHIVPTKATSDPAVPTHLNGKDDLVWGPLAGKNSVFDPQSLTCANVYCHGATLLGAVAGGTVKRSPVWNQVDGSFDACGTTCHTNPPGGAHPSSTACQTCHSAVLSSFVSGNPPVVVWKDPTLHINGTVDVVGGGGGGTLTCTSCHGDASKGPAPPKGTKGETLTTQAAVGAHAQHLGTSPWHRAGTCADCHATPTSTAHSNGKVDFSWGAPSNADGATPAFDTTSLACANVYCHGATLLGAVAGGTVKRSPVWNQVDGSFDACGTTCHTNPPGANHVNATACANCHPAVIASYAPGNPPIAPIATCADATLHINGTVDFIGGTTVTCTTCHGNAANGPAPPRGVSGETATNTLAVGRHAAHLSASSTHAAIACTSCHVVPPNGDTNHIAGYLPSSSLDSAGHHGDTSFTGQAAGTVWDVTATSGTPVTARGTCTGACHSNGRGGAPAVTPYWAGGNWTKGSCASCHAATPNTGRHGAHTGEGPCTMCHPGANTATHVNGTRDILATAAGPQGGSVALTRPTAGTCANRVACSGNCHDENHNTRCW